MNLRIVSGWLTHQAVSAYAPAGEGAAARERLCFDLQVAQEGGGEPYPEKCVIEDAALIGRVRARLTPGAAVVVEGEIRARPFYEQQVLKGFSRRTVVRRIEVLRGPKGADAPAPSPGDAL